MLSLRTHALICGGLFAAMLLIGWGGTALQGAGMLPKDPGPWRLPMMILMFTLVVAFAFSAAPVMVKLVLANQGGRVFAGISERAIVFTLWGLMAAGCAIAIPAAVQGGMFK
ncbi:MAG TPA: hypothetical protein VGF56_01675 [Rhizomicrobium sp.]|jgi:hypothetical protein